MISCNEKELLTMRGFLFQSVPAVLVFVVSILHCGAAEALRNPDGAKSDSGVVIGLLQDFEGGGGVRNTPGIPVKVELSDRTEMGKSCLRISIPKGFDWTGKNREGKDMTLETVNLYALSCPYLPPESDAIRMKVKVLSGRAIIAPGCPVSQMGNSDVLCDPRMVEAGKGDSWQTLEFSLNKRLMRNFRRPNFTKDLPVVYFTRWAQEPIYLNLIALPEKLRPEEETEIYVDQVEVVAKGEGRPFPKFENSAVKELSTIADFAAGSGLEKVFSVAHGYSISKAFEYGYRRNPGAEAGKIADYIRKSSRFIEEEGFMYPAPRYGIVEGKDGGKALQAECMWAEEGQIVTFKTGAAPDANAFRFTAKADYPALRGKSIYAFDFEGRKSHVVDLVVFVSPKGVDFPWDDIGPSEDLKKAFKESGYKGPGGKYDYLLATDKSKCIKAGDVGSAGAFGFYSTRRYLPAGEWSEMTVPFADFICVYGQGSCKEMQARHAPLSPANIAAIGFLAPYGTGHGSISFDKISFVKVPGKVDELRSFWQVPDVSKVKLERMTRFSRYGNPVIMVAGEGAPEFLE